MGFSAVDPEISNTVDDAQVEECDMDAFVTKNPKRAKLIFAKESQRTLLKKLAEQHDLTPIEDCEDLDIIRHLTKKHMLVVTKEILMRGVDYRAEDGIDLLIATTATTKRSYLQCLGRVGRGGDPAGRYILKDIERFQPQFQHHKSSDNQP